MNEQDKKWLDSHTDKMLKRAAQARSWAVSHRDFRVGCALGVRAQNKDEKPSYHIGAGANCKPQPGPTHKTCAEADALHDIGDIDDAQEIFCVLVLGVPQEDHESGLRPKTLHSCGGCRQMLKNHRLITDDTLMRFVNAENPSVVEEMTFRQLLDLHNGNGH